MSFLSDQWIRKVNLVAFDGDKGIDLSQFHIKFNIESADTESPANANIRIYNLSQETIGQIRFEFTKIVLNAGYSNGNYGVIFSGTIKQVRIGRESNVNSYFDILAADGDTLYNQGFVNESVARGSTPEDRIKIISKSMGAEDADIDQLLVNSQNIPSIRGTVLFGMARAKMRNISNTMDASWSIQDGKLVITKLSGYNPDQTVTLNAATGLIGFPEQTDGGILMTCLLNSALRIGGSVQIDNSRVNRLYQQDPNAAPVPYNQWTGIQNVAPLSPDGRYRIFAISHEGDTRGPSWYSKITGLAVDETNKPKLAVGNN